MRLFWRLAERPQTVGSVAETLGIPPKRCYHWLELLTGVGLLERRDEAYVPSPTARAAILDAYSPETWVLLAEESRERHPAGQDLALQISRPDVGIYGEALFRKLRTVLNPGGRLVIVDELAHPACVPSLSRLIHAFRASLADPDSTIPTAAEVQSLLTQAGFRLVPEQILSRGEVVIRARR